MTDGYVKISGFFQGKADPMQWQIVFGEKVKGPCLGIQRKNVTTQVPVE
jgi:hypothetical protein